MKEPPARMLVAPSGSPVGASVHRRDYESRRRVPVNGIVRGRVPRRSRRSPPRCVRPRHTATLGTPRATGRARSASSARHLRPGRRGTARGRSGCRPPRGGRGEGEQGDAAQEAQIPAKAFGQAAEEDEESGVSDGVAVQHPGQVVEPDPAEAGRDALRCCRVIEVADASCYAIVCVEEGRPDVTQIGRGVGREWQE